MATENQEHDIVRLTKREAWLESIELVPDRIHLEDEVRKLFELDGTRDVIEAPAVFTLSQWVRECSRRICLLQGEVIAASPEPFQLRNLWVKVIEKGVTGITPEESYAISGQAMNAERLMSQWLELHSAQAPGGFSNEFSGWRREVNALKSKKSWFTASDWMLQFIGQLKTGLMPGNVLPGTLTLSGFAEFTTLEKQLFGQLEEMHVKVIYTPEPNSVPIECRRQGFADLEREIAAAADWAEQQLASGCSRVAVIVNHLDTLSDRVAQIFQNHFEPDSVIALAENKNTCFSLPSGATLDAHPLVSGALLLLKMALGGRHKKHEFPDISRLLLSDCWDGCHTERFERAQLENNIRHSGYFRMSLPQLAQYISGADEPSGLQRLRNCINAVTDSKLERPPVAQFLHWLQLWGWPGQLADDQGSQAVFSRFLEVLEKLSGGEFIDAAACYLQLRRNCADEQLAGTGGVFSPIQILTPEQAYGQGFDAAWIANLTLDNWPPRPISNPFLTVSDRQFVPRANEDGMLAYTQKMTKALLSCAPRTFFSWCNRLDDLPVSSSPLISHIEHNGIDSGISADLWTRICPQASVLNGYGSHPWLRTRPDSPGQPYSMSGNPQLRGAVSLLNLQSASPLAAYLVFRLDARMEKAPGPFMDASYRGMLVHCALERLYTNSIGTQNRPSTTAIASAVQFSFEELHAQSRLLPALLEAEKPLIEGLLCDWLEYEGGLQTGVIEALEWRTGMKLGGFELEVRVDRIDRLADNKIVLLDYKTGALSALSSWAAERLRDVQLPLYASLLQGSENREIAGIAIGSLRLEGVRLLGLGDALFGENYGVSGFGPKPRGLAKQFSSWQGAMDTWSVQLGSLLEEFKDGDARHQVFHEDSLKYAGLEVLMRNSESVNWLQEHG